MDYMPIMVTQGHLYFRVQMISLHLSKFNMDFDDHMREGNRLEGLQTDNSGIYFHRFP